MSELEVGGKRLIIRLGGVGHNIFVRGLNEAVNAPSVTRDAQQARVFDSELEARLFANKHLKLFTHSFEAAPPPQTKCAAHRCNRKGRCRHSITAKLYCVAHARMINQANPQVPDGDGRIRELVQIPVDHFTIGEIVRAIPKVPKSTKKRRSSR